MFFSVPGVKKIYYSKFFRIFPDVFLRLFRIFSGFFPDVFLRLFPDFFYEKTGWNTKSRVRRRFRKSRVRRRKPGIGYAGLPDSWTTRLPDSWTTGLMNRIAGRPGFRLSGLLGFWIARTRTRTIADGSLEAPGFPSSHSWIPAFRRLTRDSVFQPIFS